MTPCGSPGALQAQSRLLHTADSADRVAMHCGQRGESSDALESGDAPRWDRSVRRGLTLTVAPTPRGLPPDGREPGGGSASLAAGAHLWHGLCRELRQTVIDRVSAGCRHHIHSISWMSRE